MPAIVTVGAQLMARALVTKLRIPDTAAQTRKSPVARSGRAEASCHDISNTWLAHGYSSSSLTTPATQSGLCGNTSPAANDLPPHGRMGRLIIGSKSALRRRFAVADERAPAPPAAALEAKRRKANAGSRSAWFPAQRYSITKFRPST